VQIVITRSPAPLVTSKKTLDSGFAFLMENGFGSVRVSRVFIRITADLG
jgi:hypothetical protein